MIDPSVIYQLKREYGQVFPIEIDHGEYILRRLTFDEYDEIELRGKTWSSVDVEDFIVRSGVLYPEIDVDRMKPGVVSTIAEKILYFSGFSDTKYASGILEQERQKVDNVRYQMMAFIMAAMPGSTEEELSMLDFAGLAHKTVMAELVIACQQEAVGLPKTNLKIMLEDETAEAAVEQAAPQYQPPRDLKPGEVPVSDPLAQKLHRALDGM